MIDIVTCLETLRTTQGGVAPLVVEFTAELILFTLLAVFFQKRFPGKPVMGFLVTSSMGVASGYYYWVYMPDEFRVRDWASLSQPVDGYGASLLAMAVAYMFADSYLLLVHFEGWSRDKCMYLFHHVCCTYSLVGALGGRMYGRLVLLMLTCEMTNIFLNGRDVAPDGPIKLVVEILFFIAFFGYRMFFLVPTLYTHMVDVYTNRPLEEFLMFETANLALWLIHFYWTALILSAVLEMFGPDKKDDDEESKKKK